MSGAYVVKHAWCVVTAIGPTKWKTRIAATLDCGATQLMMQVSGRGYVTVGQKVKCRQCSAGGALGRSDAQMGNGR